MGPFKKIHRPIEKPEAARAYALRLLSRRGYSVGEMEERLVRRAVPPEARHAVLDRLKREGLLDDGAYAVSVAQARAERGWGPRKIETALRLRRLDRDTIARALRELLPEDRVLERACRLLESRRARFCDDKTGENPRRGADRALRFLVSRGYTLDCARRAMRGFFGYNSATLDAED